MSEKEKMELSEEDLGQVSGGELQERTVGHLWNKHKEFRAVAEDPKTHTKMYGNWTPDLHKANNEENQFVKKGCE